MKKKIPSILFMLGLLGLVFVPTTAFAGASASALAKDGDNCGAISKKEGQNTGAMEVTSVKVNGKALKVGVDYTIENDRSTRPKIKFKNALAKDDVVKVGLRTGKAADFEVLLTLSHC